MPSRRLRVVTPVPLPDHRTAPSSPGDVGLLCGVLAVALIPVGGVLAGAQFAPAEAGAGAAVALLAGRELLATLRARRP